MAILAVLGYMRQIANQRFAISAPQPYETPVYLPVPFPSFFKNIPFPRSRDLPYLCLMEIERRIILVPRISFVREFTGENGLHFYNMQYADFLRNDVELSGFTSDIAINDPKSMPPQVLCGNPFPQSTNFFPTFSRDVHDL